MRIRDPQEGEEATLNITPLIDVVFLLLIFFMVATSFLDPEREIDLDLPPAVSGAAAQDAPEELVINVLQDGRVVLSGGEIDDAGLAAALLRAARRDPATPVTIRGDRLVRHERIVAVMDACGVAGLRNLAVGTMQRDGG